MKMGKRVISFALLLSLICLLPAQGCSISDSSQTGAEASGLLSSSLTSNGESDTSSESIAEASDGEADISGESSVSSSGSDTSQQSSGEESSTDDDFEAVIDEIISNMSVEEKVGQMFYVRCPESDAAEKVSEYHLGGYILFGRDFSGKTADEIKQNIQSYQDNAEIPLLIGTDEEGGTVVRVSSNTNLRSTSFLSPSDTYASGGWQAIADDAQEKADLLLSLGINVNMAPVCDMTSDPDAFMYYRSFSADLDNECRYVRTVVEISKENQLGTVLKHFPGYGNNTDTHTGIAYDDREYSEFEGYDFIPFEEGIEAGADCILAAHNIVECMDSEYPASLSENVHNIIREELGFDGVIMTDDLYMDAIRDYIGDSEAAVVAVKAGNDMLCCTDFEVQYPAVLEAVQNGEISISRIEESVRRILIWKHNLGLI